jgi:hypothetical protein
VKVAASSPEFSSLIPTAVPEASAPSSFTDTEKLNDWSMSLMVAVAKAVPMPTVPSVIVGPDRCTWIVSPESSRSSFTAVTVKLSEVAPPPVKVSVFVPAS